MTRPGAHHRARRRFAQHFLVDRGVIERMVRAISPAPGERLVEIGPGLGALTGALIERSGELDVIELDRDLAAGLPARVPHDGLRVHTGDALDFDFAALAARAGRRLRVAGNLPYNISSPLLFHLIAQGSALVDCHFTLQREVGERLTAAPGGKAYGRLTVMAGLALEAEKVFDIGPGAFRPRPRVSSAFVRLTVRREPVLAAELGAAFDAVVRRAFAGRRKTLRASLRPLLDEAAIRAAGVDPGARPETLGVAAFAALAGVLARAGGEPPAPAGVLHKIGG